MGFCSYKGALSLSTWILKPKVCDSTECFLTCVTKQVQLNGGGRKHNQAIEPRYREFCWTLQFLLPNRPFLLDFFRNLLVPTFFFFFLSNLFIYLFQHKALLYNLHYLHNFTYIIDKRVLKWTTLQYNI